MPGCRDRPTQEFARPSKSRARLPNAQAAGAQLDRARLRRRGDEGAPEVRIRDLVPAFEREPNANGDDRDDRQPLSPGRPDVRGQSRRRGRRAREPGSRAFVILEAGNANEAAQAERVGGSGPRSAFHRRPPAPGTPIRRRPIAPPRWSGNSSRRRRRLGRWARSASTTTTTTRRATCSRRCSAPRSASARELNRPVVVHTREADEDTVAILREEGGGRLRGVFHCFTGGRLRKPGWAWSRLAGRDRDVSESRRAARDRAGRAAGSPLDGNRQPVSRAGPVPRQAKQAGPRLTRRGDAGRDARRRPATWPADGGEFPHPVPAMIKFYLKRVEKTSLALSQIFEPIRADLRRSTRNSRGTSNRGRADPADRAVHPDQRRQANPSGGAADGLPARRLYRRPSILYAAVVSSSTRRRSSTTTSSTTSISAAAAWPCIRGGATTSPCSSATTSTSSRWRWR